MDAAYVLARNVKWLMTEYCYTERELAQASGVSAKTINNIKNARHGVKLDVIEAVAAAFGLSVSMIMGWNLPEIFHVKRAAESILEAFAAASDDSRELILLVAKHEAERAK